MRPLRALLVTVALFTWACTSAQPDSAQSDSTMEQLGDAGMLITATTTQSGSVDIQSGPEVVSIPYDAPSPECEQSRITDLIHSYAAAMNSGDVAGAAAMFAGANEFSFYIDPLRELNNGGRNRDTLQRHLESLHASGQRWEVTEVVTALAEGGGSVDFVFRLRRLDIDGTGVGKGAVSCATGKIVRWSTQKWQ